MKAKCGGMEINGAKRLQALEDENAKLELSAETMLHSVVVKELLAKEMGSPRGCNAFVNGFRPVGRRTCSIMGARKRYTRQPHRHK